MAYTEDVEFHAAEIKTIRRVGESYNSDRAEQLVRIEAIDGTSFTLLIPDEKAVDSIIRVLERCRRNLRTCPFQSQ